MAVGALAIVYIVVPVIALGLRVPWARLPELLRSPESWELMRVSLGAAALSTVIATALGAGLALWLQRLRHAASLVRLLVFLPLALPPVVGGLALTAAYGRRGYFSPLFDAAGWQLAFAFPGVVVAHVFVALPFVVVSIDSALRQLDPEIMASARGVGLRPWRVLIDIILPTIAPAIFTGAALACARSLGEFGTTLTFAGSMPGMTRTMPLGIYLARETDIDQAYALSALLIGMAVLTLGAAALPGMVTRRTAAPRARALDAPDIDRLRELTAPAEPGPEVRVGGVTFPAGVTTAVIGPNGSGKTTLMSVIAGRLHGEPVHIGGQDVSLKPAHERGVVMLTQRPGLPPSATVRKCIDIVSRDSGRTSDLLHAAGLLPLADVPVRQLSGGQAAQVALLRALAPRPRILILDEPLAAVDKAAASRWRQLLSIAARDRTTLVVTHTLLEVAALANHVAVMEGSAVRAVGPADDLLEVPPTTFVGELTGRNAVPGNVTNTAPNRGITTVNIAGWEGEITTGSSGDFTAATAAIITFPPEAVTVYCPPDSAPESTSGPHASISGTVIYGETTGLDSARVRVATAAGPIAATVSPTQVLALSPGTEVRLVIPAARMTAHHPPGTHDSPDMPQYFST